MVRYTRGVGGERERRAPHMLKTPSLLHVPRISWPTCGTPIATKFAQSLGFGGWRSQRLLKNNPLTATQTKQAQKKGAVS